MCLRTAGGDYGRCGLIFTSWKKFIAYQTHDKGGNHGIKSPLRVVVITNQCVNCGSTSADRPTAQNHVVDSWSKETCRTDRSHMTWSLQEVTQPISCNLREQEFSGSANVKRACSLDALALGSRARPASSTAKTQQATRKTWTRARAQGPARGTAAWSQKSSKTDGSSDQARSRHQGRAAEPQQNHAQGHHQEESEMRDFSSRVWNTVLIKASSPMKQTACRNRRRPCAEKVRQEERGHTRGPPFVWAYLGLIKSLQQRGNTVGTRTAQGLLTYRDNIDDPVNPFARIVFGHLLAGLQWEEHTVPPKMMTDETWCRLVFRDRN